MATIYPDTSEWPQNILRFHVVFDHAMDTDRALDHVRLERVAPDGRAEPVEGAVVDLVDGLWDVRQTVLTVLFHPGRVKSGLRVHAERSPAIALGERHRVVVDRALRRADGAPQGSDVSHAFAGGAPVTTPLDPSGLGSFAVGAGTAEPVRIPLDRPWDRLATRRGVGAVNESGAPISVEARTERADLVVHPVGTWPGRRVRLAVQGDVEDVCGNRTDSAFEGCRGNKGERRRGLW